jgi:hypothetical protein
MPDALQVAWYSIKDFWEEFVLLAILNFLWCLCAVLPVLPFLALNSLGLIWALVLSFPLALPLAVVSGALCFVTNQVARGKATNWAMFGQGVRRYWAKSLAVAAINVVVLVLIAGNIQFYAVIMQGGWTKYAVSAWLVVGIYWLLVQVFWFPMLLELENERVFLALRNSLVMVIITPGFSVTLALVLVLVTVLSVVVGVPLFLILAVLVLLISNHATRSRLAYVRKEPYKPGVVPD